MHTKHIYLMLLIVGCVAVFAACAKVSIPVANGTATATVPTFLSKQSFSFKKATKQRHPPYPPPPPRWKRNNGEIEDTHDPI